MPRRRTENILLREMETPIVFGIELNRITLTPQRYPVRSAPAVQPDANGPTMVVDYPPDPAPGNGILRELIALSSGTLATLCGMSRYDDLERLQEGLVGHYLLRHNPSWETWMDVWEDYRALRA